MNLKKDKKKIRIKKTYSQRINERMGEYYQEKPFKVHAKRKKDNYGEILDVINKNNENVKRKKATKAQTMTVQSKEWKQQLNIQGKEKKLQEQRMVENNSKLLLSGKTDFDPNEVLDKSLLFDLKKTS